MSVRIPGLDVYDNPSANPVNDSLSSSEETDSSSDEETEELKGSFKGFTLTEPPSFIIPTGKIGKCLSINDFEVPTSVKKYYPPISYVIATHRAGGAKVALISYDKGKSVEQDLAEFLRELRIVREMNYSVRTIHKFYDVILAKEYGSYFLAYEEFNCFLQDLLEDACAPGIKNVYETPVVKSIMCQLLQGLLNLHLQGVVHRDLRPQNIIFTSKGQLKITNFRRACKVDQKLIPTTIKDLQYQPLDVLLGAENCSTAIDMWSATCIFAYLLLKKPLFQGFSKQKVVGDIFALLGFPTAPIWSDFSKLPHFRYLVVNKVHSNNYLEVYFAKSSPQTAAAMDLIQIGLVYDPDHRATAFQCLQHPYFPEEPVDDVELLVQVIAQREA